MKDQNIIQEREIPSVANGKKGPSKGRLVAGVGIIGIAVLVGFLSLTGEQQKKKDEPVLNINKGRGLDLAPQERTPPPVPLAPPSREEAKKEEPQPPKEDEMSIAARRAPVLAIKGAARSSAVQQSSDNQPRTTVGGTGDTALQSKLNPTVLEGVTATNLQNLHMVIPQGTPIPCTLDTAISSDQPGFVTCTTPRDVLSASGQVTLMEKGTQIFGEYQSGIERGQGRIFVLWSTARTPKGVKVNLASPATDAVGRAGMDGKIDTHFWERFGNAMFLSIVQDASNYGFSRLQSSGGSSSSSGYAQSSQAATRDAAAIAVENSINIKPTLYKNQGETVAIMVARDLDFSNVYRLRATETVNQIYDRTVTGDMSPAARRPRK